MGTEPTNISSFYEKITKTSDIYKKKQKRLTLMALISHIFLLYVVLTIVVKTF
jgi:hypothetical protein